VNCEHNSECTVVIKKIGRLLLTGDSRTRSVTSPVEQWKLEKVKMDQAYGKKQLYF